MPCDLSLLVTTYNQEEGKLEQTPISLNMTVGEDEPISIDRAVEAFAALSPDIRESIVSQLSTARQQNLTKSLFTKKLQGDQQLRLVGNTTVGDLLATYPLLAKQYQLLSNKNLESSAFEKYTIIRGSNVTINNISYNGRVLLDNGQEIFIIKDHYDAEAFLRYLQAKETAQTALEDMNNLPDSIKPFAEDLKAIAKKVSLSPAETILSYLNHRDSIKPFMDGGRVITPRVVLGNIIAALANEFNPDTNMTDLEVSVSSLKTNKKGYDWKVEKTELYNLLTLHFPNLKEQISLENFKRLSAEELQALFTGNIGLFRGHPKLERAVVAAETQSTKTLIEEEPEKITKTGVLSKEDLKAAWSLVQARAAEVGVTLSDNYNVYAKQAPQDMADLFNQLHIELSPKEGMPKRLITAKVTTNRKGQPTVQYNYEYEVEAQERIKESESHITLSFPYTPLGDIYNFGYNSQSIFSPVTEGPIERGHYNGMLIYRAAREDYNGNMRYVYAISRHILSPHAHMSTYPSLETAMRAIDQKQLTERIGDNSLISIKQGNGIPRSSVLELKDLREGQIVSTLDITLPNIQFRKLPNSLKQLFELTVSEFHEKLAGIPNITKLNTAEKVAAFLYKATDLFSSDEIQRIQESRTTQGIVELLTSGNYEAQLIDITDQIDSASQKHFYVEKLRTVKETKARAKTKVATLRYLNNGGTDINLEGTRVGDISVDEFIGQTMSNAVDFFNQKFGVTITSMTASELADFNQQENLGLDRKLDSIKAFIYKGQVYINTSNAKSSDLYHEIAHIFLGVLKVQMPEAYQQLITSYQNQAYFKRKLNFVNRSYKNFALQDRIEEAVVDMIGDSLMQDSSMVQGFDQARVTELLQNIFNTIDSFRTDLMNSGLGFTEFMSKLITENQDKMAKRRMLTEFIHQSMANNKILEVDCDGM